MNVNFKVLWFEDEMGWRPSSERSMKRIIESHKLVPIITWKKGDEGDAEEELKKEYDLILMDYELRGTMGNILIKKLDVYKRQLIEKMNEKKSDGIEASVQKLISIANKTENEVLSELADKVKRDTYKILQQKRETDVELENTQDKLEAAHKEINLRKDVYKRQE